MRRLFRSLEKQSFKDFIWAIADDCSEDGTKTTVEGFKVPWVKYIKLAKRTNAGGARNAALAMTADMSEYTLYVDADDFVPDQNALQKIHDFILESNYPDLVRLSAYSWHGDMIAKQTSFGQLLGATCAPWLSCHKSDISVDFPILRRKYEDALWFFRLLDNVSYFKCTQVKFVSYVYDGPVSALHNSSIRNTPESKAAEYYQVADLLNEKFRNAEIQNHVNHVVSEISSRLEREIRNRKTTP